MGHKPDQKARKCRREREAEKAKPAASPTVAERFERNRERGAEALTEAEREAAASGKEAFDIDRLAAALGGMSERDLKDAAGLRSKYYVGHPEIRTLAEFAELLKRLEAWS